MSSAGDNGRSSCAFPGALYREHTDALPTGRAFAPTAVFSASGSPNPCEACLPGPGEAALGVPFPGVPPGARAAGTAPPPQPRPGVSGWQRSLSLFLKCVWLTFIPVPNIRSTCGFIKGWSSFCDQKYDRNLTLVYLQQATVQLAPYPLFCSVSCQEYASDSKSELTAAGVTAGCRPDGRLPIRRLRTGLEEDGSHIRPAQKRRACPEPESFTSSISYVLFLFSHVYVRYTMPTIEAMRTHRFPC